MDRTQISHLAHADHPIAAPISAARVGALLGRVHPPDGGRVLDLGCGQGEWLLTLLGRREDLTGVGVDTSGIALTAARNSSDTRGLSRRVSWHHADAATWSASTSFDVVLCVGASHAFGGLARTLQALRGHAAPGGVVVLGESFWEAAPSIAAQTALGIGENDLPDLPGLVDHVVTAGWQPITGHTSTAEEWDDYEWAWTGSLAEWAVHRVAQDREDAEHARTVATEHRAAWLRGYRHQYGFATLVLADSQQDVA